MEDKRREKTKVRRILVDNISIRKKAKKHTQSTKYKQQPICKTTINTRKHKRFNNNDNKTHTTQNRTHTIKYP